MNDLEKAEIKQNKAIRGYIIRCLVKGYNNTALTRLIASLSRTKVYKDRVKQDMRRKADIAFREMESEMLKVIKQDEKSAAQLKEILAKAKERMMEDD